MPERLNKAQKCLICEKAYCSLYFYKCSTGLDYFQNYLNSILPVPEGCLNNIVEETILSDYLKINKINSLDISNFIISRSLAEQENLNLESLLCENCFIVVWTGFVEEFRKFIQGKLPLYIKNKPLCAKGKVCKLQYCVTHTQIYTHL